MSAGLSDILATIDARVAELDAERASLLEARESLASALGPVGRIVRRPPRVARRIGLRKKTAPKAGRRPRPTSSALHKGWGKTSQRILDLLTSTPTAAADIATAMGITKAGVRYHLSRLQKRHLVARHGVAANTTWTKAS